MHKKRLSTLEHKYCNVCRRGLRGEIKAGGGSRCLCIFDDDQRRDRPQPPVCPTVGDGTGRFLCRSSSTMARHGVRRRFANSTRRARHKRCTIYVPVYLGQAFKSPWRISVIQARSNLTEPARNNENLELGTWNLRKYVAVFAVFTESGAKQRRSQVRPGLPASRREHAVRLFLRLPELLSREPAASSPPRPAL